MSHDKKRTSMWMASHTKKELDKLESEFNESRSNIIARSISELYSKTFRIKRLIATNRTRRRQS